MLSKPEHEVAYQDIVALLRKHAGHLSAVEMLAVAANMVGKLIAMQDHRILSRREALKIVADNVELGNQQMIEQLEQTKGQA